MKSKSKPASANKSARSKLSKGRGPASVTPRMSRPLVGWDTAQRIDTGVPGIVTRNDRIVVRNREIILELTAAATAGAIPTGGTSSPLAFGAGTAFTSSQWLYNLAASYDKFVVRRFRFVYQPILPVTTSGTVAIWFDSDPTAIAVPSGYSSVSGNMNAKTASIFAPIELELRPDQLNRLPQYLTALNGAGGSSLTASVGVLKYANSAVVLSSAITGTVSTGYLWADYEIELLNPSSFNS